MKNNFLKIARVAKNYVFSIMRIKTIGVRALVINRHNQVLLLKHTYLDGWYLPGGTLKYGETPLIGVKREIYEETGLDNLTDLSVFAIYLNRHEKREDYPIMYTAKVDNTVIHINDPTEIANAAWFNINELPNDVTKSTRSRIQEYLGQQPITGYW